MPTRQKASPAAATAAAGSKRKHAAAAAGDANVTEGAARALAADPALASIEDAMTAYFLEANTADELGATINTALSSHRPLSSSHDGGEGSHGTGPVASPPFSATHAADLDPMAIDVSMGDHDDALDAFTSSLGAPLPAAAAEPASLHGAAQADGPGGSLDIWGMLGVLESADQTAEGFRGQHHDPDASRLFAMLGGGGNEAAAAAVPTAVAAPATPAAPADTAPARKAPVQPGGATRKPSKVAATPRPRTAGDAPGARDADDAVPLDQTAGPPAASQPGAAAKAAAKAAAAAGGSEDHQGYQDDDCSDADGADGGSGGEGGTLDERKLKRMRRNRESAMRSRHRRKAYIEELEAKVADLTATVARLTGETWSLRQECDRLRSAAQANAADAEASAAAVSVDDLATLLLGDGAGGDGTDALCAHGAPHSAAASHYTDETAAAAAAPSHLSGAHSGSASGAAAPHASPSFAAAAAGSAAEPSAPSSVEPSGALDYAYGARSLLPAKKGSAAMVTALAGCLLVACATVLPGPQGTGARGALSMWHAAGPADDAASRSAAARRLLGLHGAAGGAHGGLGEAGRDQVRGFSLSSLWDSVRSDPDATTGRPWGAEGSRAGARPLDPLRVQAQGGEDPTRTVPRSAGIIRLPAGSSWDDAELIDRAEKQLALAASHARDGGRAEPVLIEAALSSLPAVDDAAHVLCPKALHVPRAGGAGPGSGMDGRDHQHHGPSATGAASSGHPLDGEDQRQLPGTGLPPAPLSLPTVMSLLLPWDVLARALPGAMPMGAPPAPDSASPGVPGAPATYAQVSCIVTNVTHFAAPSHWQPQPVGATSRRRPPLRRSLPAAPSHDAPLDSELAVR